MGTPTFKLIYDRQHRASKTKEGSVELRITYDRKQKHVTTGIRLLPYQWKEPGNIVARKDAYEMQRALDDFVIHAKKVVNDLSESGELDMATIVSVIGKSQRRESCASISVSCVKGQEKKSLMSYFRDRAEIRKYGHCEDSQERYDRFLRWFEAWGVMRTFADVNEKGILLMDRTLSASGMKPYSKWNNYHRFLNSFILDAIEDGIMIKNPYKRININKEKSNGGIGKYLTAEEFKRIEEVHPPVNYLIHARDLFIFQTYTCLSYTDLASFDAGKLRDMDGRKLYIGRRGKTNQEFVFLLLEPAQRILDKYGGRLPLMSNVKYNAYLKILAVMANVDKPVSSHWARHTGATLLLNSGVGMEMVAKILGHSSTKITRSVYAKLLDETVATEMLKFEKTIL